MVSEQHAEYYAARAEGGAGIIVLEEHIVHSSDMPYERAVLGYLPGTAQAVTAVGEGIKGFGGVGLRQNKQNTGQSVRGPHPRGTNGTLPRTTFSYREESQ